MTAEATGPAVKVDLPTRFVSTTTEQNCSRSGLADPSLMSHIYAGLRPVQNEVDVFRIRHSSHDEEVLHV